MEGNWFLPIDAKDFCLPMSDNTPAFRFRLGDKVHHQDAETSTFVVTRRWLDVDASEGQSRYYELRDERPLFGQGKVGPVLEGELRLAE